MAHRAKRDFFRIHVVIKFVDGNLRWDQSDFLDY